MTFDSRRPVAGLTRRELVRRATAAGVLLTLPGSLLGCAFGSDRRSPSGLESVGAGRAGLLPPDGRPIVADLQLPSGKRWAPELLYTRGPEPGFVGWATDDGVDGAFELARRLAEPHRSTGLWPCLWDSTEGPAYYCINRPGVDAVDAAKARSVLAKRWTMDPPRASWVAPLGRRFPGLADPTARPSRAFDPFGLLESRRRLEATWNPEAVRPRLLLIPCRHPADAIAAIGFECGTAYSGVEDPALVSSVLRSWEQRFQAVLVELAPGGFALAVGAPPTSFDHALRIAAEHFALAPRGDAGAPGALARVAEELLGGNPPYTVSSRDIWELGWND